MVAADQALAHECVQKDARFHPLQLGLCKLSRVFLQVFKNHKTKKKGLQHFDAPTPFNATF